MTDANLAAPAAPVERAPAVLLPGHAREGRPLWLRSFTVPVVEQAQEDRGDG